MKTGIIFNPAAGSVASDQLETVKQKFPGRAFEVAATSKAGGGAAAAMDLLKLDLEEIWVLGGDGTLSEVAQLWGNNWGAEAAKIRWGILPTGRGNDFFRGLLWTEAGGRPESGSLQSEAFVRLEEGRSAPVDLVQLTFWDESQASLGSRILLNVGSGGYGGEVVRRVVTPTPVSRFVKPVLKRGIYLYETVVGGLGFVPEQVRLMIDGSEVFEGVWNTLFVLNGKCNGGGMCWNREARPDDGRLHFTLLQWTGLLPPPGWGLSMWSGDWTMTKHARVWKGQSFEIERKNPLQNKIFWDLDGDCPEPLGWTICRGKVLEAAMNIIF